MTAPEMLTKIDVSQLSAAFPASIRADALEAAKVVSGILHERQWANQESYCVGGEEILIPRRLRLTQFRPTAQNDSRVEQMIACLQTQSCDGFERQRALQSLLPDVRAWSAPFIVRLIGEYVIEIIEDIEAEATPSNLEALTSCIAENREYWELTKQRVASYWNVYYRHRYTRRNYPGFQLVKELESALRSRSA